LVYAIHLSTDIEIIEYDLFALIKINQLTEEMPQNKKHVI